MALTVTCARCHDHKYDPIPTADYYSLYGVLASSIEPEQPADFMTLADAEQPHRAARVRARQPGQPGSGSAAAVSCSVLSGENRQPFNNGSGRLELAHAIASRDNPLTARVIVNRVWLHHFGAAAGAHAQRFRHCAASRPAIPSCSTTWPRWLVDDGWSLKKLHRLILLLGHLSASQRRSAASAGRSIPRIACCGG